MKNPKLVEKLAKLIKFEMVDGWEDLKLDSLLQAILEGNIEDQLLTNLSIFQLKKENENGKDNPT